MSDVARQTDPAIARRFDILELAGSGGMGHVFRARERTTGQLVALKVLPHAGGDPLRFAREADVLGSLDHARIVRYLDHGETEQGTHFLAMEWLEGCDLSARMRTSPLSVADTLTVGNAIAQALAAAHAEGIVHRDLKPGNVFLVGDRAEGAKLIDFGLARPLAYASVTVSGAVVGTPAYMSPEQVRGDVLDHRVDVYGLGAVLHAALTGHAPFHGAHQVAVLAKVALEAAPSVRATRSDVPDALEALIARMLAKEPAERPSDMQDVLRELAAIEEGASTVTRTIARSEQRVACVVLSTTISGPEDQTMVARGAARGAPVGDVSGAPSAQSLRAIIEEAGGTIHALAQENVLVTIRGASTPVEQASRAARSALALSRARPGAPVVVVTGRVIVQDAMQVGEAIDRAAQALHEARIANVSGARIDAKTAELISSRFELARDDDDWFRLGDEKVEPSPTQRTLLGRPSPCVGRTRELATLDAARRSCIEDQQAHAIFITAAAGFGKSRLLQEFVGSLGADGGPRDDGAFDVRFARGETFRAGSPFALVSTLVEDAGGERLRALFRDLAASALARDATTLADAVREEFVDWLGRALDIRPVLLVVEDVHWSDPASLRLLDAALSAHADRSLLLVGTARLDDRLSLRTVFRHAFQELSLGPIPRRAGEGFVRDALGTASDDTVRAVVDRAGGHPFYLEELVRAVAAGHSTDALPESVLGMIQLRLDELDPDSRRILRAASLYGDRFATPAVALVVGSSEHETNRRLSSLVTREVLTKRAEGYGFRHALIRDAAYATFTEDDRALGHRLAAEWLERAGELDPAVLAEHWWRAFDRPRTLPFVVRAAKLALEASDFDRATSHVARARECAPDSATLGALFAIEAEIGYWRGDLDRAVEHASAANERVEPGSGEWFSAASAAIGAHGQRGQNDDVARWLRRVTEAPLGDGSQSAQATAMSRGLTQLLWAHHGDAPPMRARLEELVARDTGGELDPFARGWVERVRAEAAWLHDGDVDAGLSHFASCCAAFESARATRYLCLARLNMASLAGWAGDRARAAELMPRAEVDAARLGSPFLAVYARAIRGMLSTFEGDPGAEAMQRSLFEPLAGNPRLSFVIRIFAGECAYARGDYDAAERDARAALAMNVVAELRPAGPALLSRALLARRQLAEALDYARQAVTIERRPDFELFDGLPELALAEALEATGDRSDATRVLGVAHTRLATVASSIADEAARARFWSRRVAIDRIHALHRVWQ